MSNCNNCNANCFERVSDDCIYSVSDIDQIGSKKGDSLNSILKKLAEIKDLIDSGDVTDGGSDSVDLGNITIIDSVKEVSNNRFSISITPGKTDTSIMYDLSGALPSGNSNVVSVQAYGTFEGRTTRIANSNTSIGSFKASPENFPVNIMISVTSVSQEGQSSLTFQKALSNSKATLYERFNVNSISGKSIDSQAELNEVFDTKIGSLSNQIKDIADISFNGISGLNNIFIDIQSKVDELNSKESEDVSDLKELITSLTNSMSDAIVKFNDQNNTILQLQSDISKLKTALKL